MLANHRKLQNVLLLLQICVCFDLEMDLERFRLA